MFFFNVTLDKKGVLEMKNILWLFCEKLDCKKDLKDVKNCFLLSYCYWKKDLESEKYFWLFDKKVDSKQDLWDE